jgi:WD40 repeat protein
MLDFGEDAVTAIAFSRDGERLAVARGTDGHGGGVKVWDTNSARLLPAFYENRSVRDVCFSPTKRMLAGAGSWGVALREGEEGWESSPPGGPANGPAWALAFSTNGKWLAALVGSNFKHRTICVWNMENLREVRGPKADDAEMASLAFSHDGKYLAAGDEDGVKLWSTSDWKLFKELPISGRVTAMAFSPSRDYLAVAVGSVVQFWDARGGWAMKASHRWRLDARATCLAYTSDGKMLACGTADGFVHLWDASGQKPQQKKFEAHKAGLVALAFMPESRVIATGGSDKTVKLFDVVKTPAGTPATTKPATNSGARPSTKVTISAGKPSARPTTGPAIFSVGGAGTYRGGVR